MSTQKIINYLDIYGYTPNLYIGGFKSYGSILGIMSSISSIILSFLITLYFFLKLFNTNEFTVVSSEITPEGIESIELSSKTFYFGFGLQDPLTYKPILDETIYYPKIYYRLGQRHKEEGFIWYNKSLEFGVCELSDFNNEYQKFFVNYDLSNMYCIKNLNESIRGIFKKSEYSLIFVELFQCVNTTEKSNCKPQDVIDYYLNGTFLSLDYQDIAIDHTNFKNPGVPSIGEFYTTVSKNYYKEIHIYYKKVVVESDRGWIFTNYKKREYTQYDKSEDMISFKSSSDGNFLEFSIKFGDKITKYYRTYTKAQTIISNIGGFLRFIEVVFRVICYIFVDNQIYQHIINKLFYIGNKQNNTQNKLIKFQTNYINFNNSKKNFSNIKSNLFKKKNTQKINNHITSNLSRQSYEQSPLFLDKNNDNNRNLNLNSLSNKILINNTYIHASINNSMNYLPKNYSYVKLKSYSKNLNLTYCQRFYSRLIAKGDSNIIKLYKKGIGLIKQKLDVISIVRNSLQFSFLKSIILNKEHILVLDHIIKFELNKQENDISLISLDNVEKIKSDAKDAYNIIADRSMKKKNEFNFIDIYFVELLNEQFNNCFNKNK